MWEPDGEQLQGKPLVPPGLQFAGRPQLIARKPGRGTGRSLLLDGHINVVSAEPRSSWTSDPFTPEVHDGNRYGRGACDMKGDRGDGVRRRDARLARGRARGRPGRCDQHRRGSSGAGRTALVARGLEADAGIVTEPTGFYTWVACRSSG